MLWVFLILLGLVVWYIASWISLEEQGRKDMAKQYRKRYEEAVKRNEEAMKHNGN